MSPLTLTNVLRRHLHPALKKLGLRDYWLSHAGNTMDDLYDMVKDNAAFRKQKAAEYGVGFELPASIAPVVSKNRAKTRRAKAA